MSEARETEKQTMLRNMAIVTFAGYFELAVGLLSGIVIARTLGPSDYGHYAYAVWLCGVLVIFTNNALTSSSIKFLAELRGSAQPELAHVLMHKFQRWQMITGLLALIGFAAYSLIQPMDGWHQSFAPMLAMTIIAVWSRAGFWLQGAFGKGFENFIPENIALALTALLNLIFTFVLAWRGASVLEFFAVYTTLGVASYLLVHRMLRRSGVRPQAGPLPTALLLRVRKHILLTGFLILLSALANRAVEMSLLKHYAGPESVAYFAVAGALSKGAVDLLAAGLTAVLLPSMSRQYGLGGAKSLAKILVESTRLYWFMGLIVAGLGLTVADGAIRVLYGARYIDAIPALNWQLLISGLVLMNGAALAALTADDRQFDRIVISACALAFNAVLGYLLIKPWGLSGAIASSVMTQCFASIFIWAYTLRRTRAQLLLGPMARLLVAAALATSVAWSLTHLLAWRWGFIVGAAVFFTLYLTLSVCLRTWRQSDYAMFASLLSRAGSPGQKMAPKLTALGLRFGIADNVKGA